jgi:hypothetical protein
MSNVDELDALIKDRMHAVFDQVDPERPPFAPPTRRRRRRTGVIAVAAVAVLVATPAAAVGVHKLLVDRAFSDMGVQSHGGKPPHHLILESRVSGDLAVRLYRADAPAQAQGGKTGDCVFAETVVDHATSGGKGFCFTSEAGASPVLSARQYVVVKLPGGDRPTSVTAERGTTYHATAVSKEGFVVLPPVGTGPLVLDYRAQGEHRQARVEVP